MYVALAPRSTGENVQEIGSVYLKVWSAEASPGALQRNMKSRLPGLPVAPDNGFGFKSACHGFSREPQRSQDFHGTRADSDAGANLR